MEKGAKLNPKRRVSNMFQLNKKLLGSLKGEFKGIQNKLKNVI